MCAQKREWEPTLACIDKITLTKFCSVEDIEGEDAGAKRQADGDTENKQHTDKIQKSDFCKCTAKCATKGLCICRKQGGKCEAECHPKNKKLLNNWKTVLFSYESFVFYNTDNHKKLNKICPQELIITVSGGIILD